MPEWSTACPDWAARLRAGESIIPPPIFPDQAEAGLAVMRELRIVDAAGSPTIAEACEPWVFELAASIFGAYDAETGRRLITEWFVCVPKKNSKSTIAAAIMLTALILNWRQSARFTILAPTIEIANNSYEPARDMCAEQYDEDLAALMHVQTHVKTITHRESNASLKVLAADEKTVGGAKSVGTLVDELWLLGKQPGAANMLREAIGGLAARPEGFVIYLTTQSGEPPAGVFKQKLDYARNVRDGKILDPKFVPVIYEFPPDMIKSGAFRDVENFQLVNPNWGRSVDPEFIEREHKKAIEGGDEDWRDFLAKHGNVEIGMNLRGDRWTGAEFWEQQSSAGLTLDEILRRSEVVTVGIDGGGLDDLLGLAVVGREKKTGHWLGWTHAWAHPIALQRRKSEESKYRDFQNDGDLTVIEALPEDVSEVAKVVEKVWLSGLLASVGMDPEKTHKVMLKAITDKKVPEEICFAIPQGWKLYGAITVAERKLAEHQLFHGGQALMNWCVGNAKVELRGNAALITKQASGVGKIDPLMALLNAVSLMNTDPEPAKKKHQFFAIG
jgi:phage terminase large subunit-like protein